MIPQARQYFEEIGVDPFFTGVLGEKLGLSSRFGEPAGVVQLMIFGQLHLNLGRPCTSHNFPLNQEEVTSFDVWRRRHVHVHARWKTNGCSQWFLPCSVRPGETTARRALILQSKSTVQEEKVLSSSSPSIGLCMLSLYQQTRTLWYSMLLTLLNRSNIPLSRDNWQQSVISTSAMATSLTLGSSFACTLSAVALRD